jgi:hypothetical protein
VIAGLRNADELLPGYFEDPLSFFGKGLRGMGMEALSRTNPLSTARQATDPRKSLAVKALNLGAGIRVLTVSEGSREAILREQVQIDFRVALSEDA